MIRQLIVSIAAIACAGCATPYHRTPRSAAPPVSVPRPAVSTVGRPTVGVAFGGGSAKGISHVGVIRWLEEHRIPIDVAVGTSMGGLVGGAYASGMDARELEAFISTVNWDELFNRSTFAHKNIRRKVDARAYPTRLEFGLKGGIVPPTALNSGEQVELLLGRIGAPYFDIKSFDELPTPFRAVAVDLLSAQQVVLERGSLADAMRATMSLPLIFPPMEIEGQVLIDGGTMNNVPADVVKTLGVSRVIAVNVGDLSDREGVTYTMFGVAGDTLDAMMRASTRRALAAADVLINVPKKFGSLDWRRTADLIEEGYRAAESMRDQLLPLALSEPDFQTWRRERKSRRRTELPVPSFVHAEGFAANDARRLDQLLARHVGVPLDIAALEKDLAAVTGLDRYQTVTWRMTRETTGGYGVLVHGRLKTYAPPFMMLGVNLENTTSSDFRITATARYLAFDTVGSGSELRVDGTLGSEPSLAAELYRPIGRTPFFIAPYAAGGTATLNVVSQDAVVARYEQKVVRLGASGGINLGARSDLRLGAYIGRTSASIKIGDPGFPELGGTETGTELTWRLDTQDSAVAPASGVASEVRLSHVFDSPGLSNGDPINFDRSFTQLAAAANRFWSVGAGNRVFAYAAAGTSFDAAPLPTHQFSLGTPFRLGAFRAGELRGSHYYVVTGGYLQRIGRLPDFMGGPVFAGAWLENGDALEDWNRAGWRRNAGVGLVMDTLVGPVVLAGSWGFDQRWRTYLGVGRTFR